MIAAGDVTPRRDTEQELFVVVVSNAVHLSAATGRVIVCPFIPGDVPADAMALVVASRRPPGVVLPELLQWLPATALGEPVGNIGASSLGDATAIITALLS